jgi:hypothetical protein
MLVFFSEYCFGNKHRNTTFVPSSESLNQVIPSNGLIYKEVARDRLFDPLATLPYGEGANS